MTALPGTCEVVPAGADYWARWHTDKEVAVFSLESSWLNEIAQQDSGTSDLELEADALPFTSKRICALAAMLQSEFVRTGGSLHRLYTDSLLTLLGLELIANHSNNRSLCRNYRSYKLSPVRLLRAIEYMNANVSEPLTLADLAKTTGYSPNYFLRAFKQETGQTPHQYLINLRLDIAQKLLASTTMSIAEISLRAGFSGQGHLTSTMSRERKVTPGGYRRMIRRGEKGKFVSLEDTEYEPQLIRSQ